MNKKIRLGILGGGGDSLIGVLHRVASSMFDRYEICLLYTSDAADE